MAWSKELQNRTRNDIFPGAILKNEQWDFGSYFPEADGTIILKGVEMKNHFPVPSDEIVATYENLDAMIKAGWVLD